ncbi:MAG: cyclic nucleotide-binding protein [Gemmatimonadetes bacterium]|nr:cyclic nucleotide-binding protein [Gemmatimonadota bacterium]
MSDQSLERNELLRAIPAYEYERLSGSLEHIEFRQGDVIVEADGELDALWFPRGATLSMMVLLDRSPPTESATIGFEGYLGFPLLAGARVSGELGLVQVPGACARLSLENWHEHLASGESVMVPLLLRAGLMLFEQMAQTIACNRRHAVVKRCARWLLMTHDRAGNDRFALTHEYLSRMLGTRRATVTVAAAALQKAGLIEYSRGKIHVIDRAGLEEASCECYGQVRRRSERIARESALVEA